MAKIVTLTFAQLLRAVSHSLFNRMSHPSRRLQAALFAALFSVSLTAAAQSTFETQDRSKGVYIDLGRAPHGADSSNSLTAGLVVPYALTEGMKSGPLSFYADYFAAVWNAPRPTDVGGYHNYYQIGAIAMWRWRFAGGASPWFAEAGIGVTTMNDLYETPVKEFSTRFQFTEPAGVGYTFGDHGQQEVSLRLQHFSNGHVKTPNPGENWVRVRYLYRF
jgi:lipid A 3-O-deacylase